MYALFKLFYFVFVPVYSIDVIRRNSVPRAVPVSLCVLTELITQPADRAFAGCGRLWPACIVPGDVVRLYISFGG